jgi:hypothetical protein
MNLYPLGGKRSVLFLVDGLDVESFDFLIYGPVIYDPCRHLLPAA